MAIRKISSSSAINATKSNRFWDGSTERGPMVPIGTVAANGLSPNMSFNNIPQIYTDLVIVVVGRSFWPSYTTYSVYVNGTGYVGWSQTSINGNSTSANSSRQIQSTPTYGIGQSTAWTSTTSDIFSSSIVNIFDYTNTSKNKTGLAQNAIDNSTDGSTEVTVGTWQNTAAITSIDLGTNGNWMTGSYATLYGIKAGA